MTILAEGMNIDRRASGAAVSRLNTGTGLGRTLIQRARARRDEALLSRTIRGLDRLDDCLLKDVGLFREHLPSGATHVRRR